MVLGRSNESCRLPVDYLPRSGPLVLDMVVALAVGMATFQGRSAEHSLPTSTVLRLSVFVE